MDFRIADTFTGSLAKLTGEEQKAGKTTAFDLQINPASPGMKFHRLDKAKDNDIKWTEGSYSTWPGRKRGHTIFLYKARIETGKAIPKWLEEDLTESSLKKYLVYVKEVAER